MISFYISRLINRAEDKDGRLVEISKGISYGTWTDAIASEYNHNMECPDGAYKVWLP